MKIGSLKAGGRDGTLVVVSRDLTRAACIPGIVATVAALLEHWDECLRRVEEAYELLNVKEFPDDFPLEPEKLAAPLPRPARRCCFIPPGAMREASCDLVLGPRDEIVADEALGVALEPQLAVLTGTVAMGASAEKAHAATKLVLLGAEVSLRAIEAKERDLACGPFQSRPSIAFAPVAVTPNELGPAWDRGRLRVQLSAAVNGSAIGAVEAAADLASLVVHAAATRPVSLGTIIGAAPQNAPAPLMNWGGRVRLEALDHAGHSIFGAIEPSLAAPS
jgi:fumarylacetoacetate (FAA) hydrolase